jgi:hypothetical protein
LSNRLAQEALSDHHVFYFNFHYYDKCLFLSYTFLVLPYSHITGKSGFEYLPLWFIFTLSQYHLNRQTVLFGIIKMGCIIAEIGHITILSIQ